MRHGERTRRRVAYWKRVEVIRQRKARAEADVKRALRRLDRTGEEARGPGGDAELAHAEGRLRGLEDALRLHEQAAELVDAGVGVGG